MAFSRMHIRGGGVIITLISTLSLFLPFVRIAKSSEVGNNLDAAVENFLYKDNFTTIPSVIVKKNNVSSTLYLENDVKGGKKKVARSLLTDIGNYAKSHPVTVSLPDTVRFFTPAESGKSSFMAGFGMGFLAFALKKLLLPIVFGAQVIKSLLIILFLPSLVGSFGKLLGKGLSTVSGISGASGLAGQPANNQVLTNFDFKETDPYSNLKDVSMDNEFEASDDLGTESSTSATVKRLGMNQRVAYVPYKSEDYYMKIPSRKTDFKVFHKIPSSTLLLATYDPFYSPLLSRLDTVFQQLGLGNEKSPETERCRERLICMMYANPAKFAPYSNLVSAQLSRELNELKKPTSDNPEILRFFRYMKAARDGQDGEECLAHVGCPSLMSSETKPALLTTYNEINKLVQARKL